MTYDKCKKGVNMKRLILFSLMICFLAPFESEVYGYDCPSEEIIRAGAMRYWHVERNKSWRNQGFRVERIEIVKYGSNSNYCPVRVKLYENSDIIKSMGRSYPDKKIVTVDLRFFKNDYGEWHVKW